MNSEKFFNLIEGEKIVKDIKPLPNLKWYFYFRTGIAFFIILFFFLPLFFISTFLAPSFSFILFIIVLILLAIPWLISRNMYKHQHYWITNKRVIYKRGFLGYKISSIPLERISDVIVSRTFLERIFGFGSVHIQSLAGQFTYGRRMGAEASLLAVPNPEILQKQIFELIKKKRKEEKLTM